MSTEAVCEVAGVVGTTLSILPNAGIHGLNVVFSISSQIVVTVN